MFCRRFGVPLVDLGTVRLPQLVGLGRAMDLVLTGRPVKAQEAWGMGLVNRVVPRGSGARAARWSSPGSSPPSPRPACATTGRSMLESLELDARAALENEVRRGQETLASGETSAGAARFQGGAGRHGQ